MTVRLRNPGQARRAIVRPATVPRLVIVLELEAAPRLYVECEREGDERRLRAWIASSADIRELAVRATEIARERRAA